MFKWREKISWVLIFALAAWITFPTDFLYRPYKGVDVTSVEKLGEGWLRVTANFVKVRCTFQRMEVVKSSLGVYQLTEWRPVDNEFRDYDRQAGKHTLVIDVNLEKFNPTNVQIKTRHLCGDKIVDRVFADIEIE